MKLSARVVRGPAAWTPLRPHRHRDRRCVVGKTRFAAGSATAPAAAALAIHAGHRASRAVVPGAVGVDSRPIGSR